MRVGVGTSTKFEDFAGIEQTLSSFVATETRAGALNLRPSYALPRNCPLPHPSSFLLEIFPFFLCANFFLRILSYYGCFFCFVSFFFFLLVSSKRKGNLVNIGEERICLNSYDLILNGSGKRDL